MGWISPDAFSHANQVEKDRKAKCQRWGSRPAPARQAAPNQQPRVRSGAYASWKGRAGWRRRGKRLFPSSTFCLHGFPQTLNYLFPFPTAFRVSYSPVCTRQETSGPVPGEGNARSSPRASPEVGDDKSEAKPRPHAAGVDVLLETSEQAPRAPRPASRPTPRQATQTGKGSVRAGRGAPCSAARGHQL